MKFKQKLYTIKVQKLNGVSFGEKIFEHVKCRGLRPCNVYWLSNSLGKEVIKK